jgi:hypothetical protein
MLVLGILLFVILTFVAALISGVGVYASALVAAVMVVAFSLSRQRVG